MIVDKINEYLSKKEFSLKAWILDEIALMSENAFKRQFMEEKEDKRGLYISTSGDCPRKLAYQYLGIETKGKAIDVRARVNFFLGDVIEMAVVGLAKLSGCDLVNTGLEQIHLEHDFEDFKISGYPDGILVAEENYLVEIKSMTDYAFDEFEKGVIDRKYLSQINLEMEIMKLNKCVFVALNKVSGVLNERVFGKDEKIVTETLANLRKVAASTKEALPDRPDYIKPNAKGFLPYNCIYCPAWITCWGDEVEKVLVGGAYKLRVKK